MTSGLKGDFKGIVTCSLNLFRYFLIFVFRIIIYSTHLFDDVVLSDVRRFGVTQLLWCPSSAKEITNLFCRDLIRHPKYNRLSMSNNDNCVPLYTLYTFIEIEVVLLAFKSSQVFWCFMKMRSHLVAAGFGLKINTLFHTPPPPPLTKCFQA